MKEIICSHDQKFMRIKKLKYSLTNSELLSTRPDINVEFTSTNETQPQKEPNNDGK